MQALEVNGTLRDLRHLRRRIVAVPSKGRDGADLRVAVNLGLHTISRACQPGESSNMQDENGRPRIFCEDRYGFSLGLPEITTRMIDQKYFCWESRDRNQAMNYAVLDAAPGWGQGLADGTHQVIYFYLYPGNGRDAEVHLQVVSCHMRYLRFTQIKRRFDMHMLLRKCLFEGKRLP